MALLRFTAAYRAAGFELAGGELPDHLAVLCEFTAAAPEAGLALFRGHRAGLSSPRPRWPRRRHRGSRWPTPSAPPLLRGGTSAGGAGAGLPRGTTGGGGAAAP